jgi:hypothetical protein
MTKQKNIFIFFAIIISLIFCSSLVCAGSRITNIYETIGEQYSLINSSNGLFVFYPYSVGGFNEIGYQKSVDNGASWEALTNVVMSGVNNIGIKSVIKNDLIYLFYVNLGTYKLNVDVFNSTSESFLYNLDCGFTPMPQGGDGGWGDVGLLSNQTIYYWFMNGNYFDIYYFDETTNVSAEKTHYLINTANDWNVAISNSYPSSTQMKLVMYNDTYFVFGASVGKNGGGYIEQCSATYPNSVRVYLSNDGGVSFFSNTTYSFQNCYGKNFFELFFDNSANLHLLRGANITEFYLVTHERRLKSSGVWAQMSINEFYSYPTNYDNDIFNYEYYNTLADANITTYGMSKSLSFHNLARTLNGFLYPNMNDGINYAIYNETTGHLLIGEVIDGSSCGTDYFFPQVMEKSNMQYNNWSDILHLGVIRLVDSSCYEWKIGISIWDWLPNISLSPNYLEYYTFDLSTLTTPVTLDCVPNHRVNSTCNCFGFIVDACYVDSLNCLDTWCCASNSTYIIGTSAQCFSFLSASGFTTTNTSGGLLITPDTSNIANMFGLLTANQKLLAGTIALLVIGIVGAVMGFGGFVIIIILVLGTIVFYAMGFLPAWLLYLLAILGVSGLAVTARNMFGAGTGGN